MLDPVPELQRLVDQFGLSFVADHAGVHRTTLLRWIRRQVKPPAQAANLVRAALGYLPGPIWEGWRVDRTGILWSDDGQQYRINEVAGLHWTRGAMEAYRQQVRELEALIRELGRDPAVRGDSANDAAINYIPATPKYPTGCPGARRSRRRSAASCASRSSSR